MSMYHDNVNMSKKSECNECGAVYENGMGHSCNAILVIISDGKDGIRQVGKFSATLNKIDLRSFRKTEAQIVADLLEVLPSYVIREVRRSKYSNDNFTVARMYLRTDRSSTYALTMEKNDNEYNARDIRVAVTKSLGAKANIQLAEIFGEFFVIKKVGARDYDIKIDCKLVGTFTTHKDDSSFIEVFHV